MAHPLQSHYDRVSALLRELRSTLEDRAVFRSRREWFDEYLGANELELALHSACDALLEDPFDKPSAEVLKKIGDLYRAWNCETTSSKDFSHFDLRAAKTFCSVSLALEFTDNETLRAFV